MTKYVSSIITLLFFGLVSSAQNSYEDFRRQAQEQFQQFKEQKQSEFEAYRDRVNREYAEFMSHKWAEFKAEPAMPVPPSPEPPKPVVADPSDKPFVDQLPFESVKPHPPVLPQPTPLLPEPQPTPTPQPEPTPQEDAVPAVSFDFYGKRCTVPFDNALHFSLKDNSEKSVAKAWKLLSAQASIPTINGCVNLGKSLRLSDWGYLRLVEKLAEAAFPGEKTKPRC